MILLPRIESGFMNGRVFQQFSDRSYIDAGLCPYLCTWLRGAAALDRITLTSKERAFSCKNNSLSALDAEQDESDSFGLCHRCQLTFELMFVTITPCKPVYLRDAHLFGQDLISGSGKSGRYFWPVPPVYTVPALAPSILKRHRIRRLVLLSLKLFIVDLLWLCQLKDSCQRVVARRPSRESHIPRHVLVITVFFPRRSTVLPKRFSINNS